jgi:hypothetical protein
MEFGGSKKEKESVVKPLTVTARAPIPLPSPSAYL